MNDSPTVNDITKLFEANCAPELDITFFLICCVKAKKGKNINIRNLLYFKIV